MPSGVAETARDDSKRFYDYHESTLEEPLVNLPLRKTKQHAIIDASHQTYTNTCVKWTMKPWAKRSAGRVTYYNAGESRWLRRLISTERAGTWS